MRILVTGSGRLGVGATEAAAAIAARGDRRDTRRSEAESLPALAPSAPGTGISWAGDPVLAVLRSSTACRSLARRDERSESRTHPRRETDTLSSWVGLASSSSSPSSTFHGLGA